MSSRQQSQSFRLASMRFERQTKRIIKSYLRHKIFPGKVCRRSDNESNPSDALIAICADFEQRYHDRFSSIVEEIKANGESRNLLELRDFFNGVANDLFPDCVKWGRIVALFSFAGCLCEVMCGGHRPKSTSVRAVENWLGLFMKRRVNSWIFLSGGWDFFMAYFKRTTTNRRRSELCSISWFPITGIALGLMTITRFFMKRFEN